MDVLPSLVPRAGPWVLAVLLVGPLAVASAGPTHVQGQLRFLKPGAATSDVEFRPDWVLHWSGPTGKTGGLESYEVEAANAHVHYVETVRADALGGSSVPTNDSQADVRGARVIVDGRPMSQWLDMVSTSAEGHVSSSTPWSVRTGDLASVLDPSTSTPAGGPPQVVFDSTTGRLRAEGDISMTLSGFNVRVENDAGEVHDYRTGRTDLPVALELYTVHRESRLELVLTHAHVGVAFRTGNVRVAGPSLALDGAFGVDGTEGRLMWGGRPRVVDNERVELTGQMVLTAREAPATPAASHSIDVDGLVERAATGPASSVLGGAVPLAIVVAATAGIGLLLLAAFLLFTRKQTNELLDSDARRRVHHAVVENPGVVAAELADLVGVRASTLRHHLHVLTAHGVLRAFKVRGVWHYVPPTENVDQRRRALLLADDPNVQYVLDRMQAAPGAPARQIAQSLEADLGLSRSGSWRVIERAVDQGLAVKDYIGPDLVLRPSCSSQQPAL